MLTKRPLVAALAFAFGALSSAAHADAVGDLQKQMEALQQQLDAVKAQLSIMQHEREQEQAKAKANTAPAGGPFVQLKPNAGLTFLVPGGGEVQLYGNLDVSFDYTTKGFQSDYGDNGGVPVGKVGWSPSIATNLS